MVVALDDCKRPVPAERYFASNMHTYVSFIAFFACVQTTCEEKVGEWPRNFFADVGRSILRPQPLPRYLLVKPKELDFVLRLRDSCEDPFLDVLTRNTKSAELERTNETIIARHCLPRRWIQNEAGQTY